MRIVLSKANIRAAYDITDATGMKTWSGSFSVAPRSLSFNFYSNPVIDVEIGDWILMVDEFDNELFRGLVRRFDRSQNGLEKRLTVYDSFYWWVRNRDTFSFKNRTIQHIFRTICNRFDIPIGNVAESDYEIPSQIDKDAYLYDVIKKSMSEVYQATGERFYVRDNAGRADLLKRVERVQLLNLSTDSNVSTFTDYEDAENIATVVKLTSGTGSSEHIVTATNNDLIQTFGTIQHYEKIDSNYSEGKLLETAIQVAMERSKIDRSMTIKSLGDFNIISGEGVFVNIPSIQRQRAYYVQGDSHTFDRDEHVMTLQLLETLELGG